MDLLPAVRAVRGVPGSQIATIDTAFVLHETLSTCMRSRLAGEILRQTNVTIAGLAELEGCEMSAKEISNCVASQLANEELPKEVANPPTANTPIQDPKIFAFSAKEAPQPVAWKLGCGCDRGRRPVCDPVTKEVYPNECYAKCQDKKAVPCDQVKEASPDAAPRNPWDNNDSEAATIFRILIDGEQLETAPALSSTFYVTDYAKPSDLITAANATEDKDSVHLFYYYDSDEDDDLALAAITSAITESLKALAGKTNTTKAAPKPAAVPAVSALGEAISALVNPDSNNTGMVMQRISEALQGTNSTNVTASQLGEMVTSMVPGQLRDTISGAISNITNGDLGRTINLGIFRDSLSALMGGSGSNTTTPSSAANKTERILPRYREDSELRLSYLELLMGRANQTVTKLDGPSSSSLGPVASFVLGALGDGVKDPVAEQVAQSLVQTLSQGLGSTLPQVQVVPGENSTDEFVVLIAREELPTPDPTTANVTVVQPPLNVTAAGAVVTPSGKPQGR